MGRRIGKTAVVKEREEYIVELLKAEKGESVSGSTFDRDLSISPSVRSNLISGLKKMYPQIKNTAMHGTEAMYAWIEPKVEVKPVQNEEPVKAATNKELRKIQPGEVWMSVESNGSRQPIFVLNSLNGAAQCIKLYKETSERIGIIGKDYFQVQIGQNAYVGDPTHVTFKPLKYLSCKEANADETKLTEARWMLGRIFGIAAAEKEVIKEVPVEKVVEKEVIKEVPVEKIVYKEKEKEETKIPDDYVSTQMARIAILTEQRDIWKTVALKLLERGAE